MNFEVNSRGASTLAWQEYEWQEYEWQERAVEHGGISPSPTREIRRFSSGEGD